MSPLGRGALAALLLHSTLIQAVVFLLRPATSYQALALGTPVAALGAVGAGFALIPLLLAVPAGSLVDRLGSKRMMIAGAAVTTLAAGGLLAFGTSLTGIIISTAMLGAGHLGCIVSQQSIVANTSGPSRLDSMFGYYTFAASLGQAVGPLLIPIAGGSGVQPNTASLFIVGLSMSGGLLILSFLIPDARASRTDEGAAAGSWWAILRLPGVTRAIATSALIVAAVDLTVVYIPALGPERGLSAVAIGSLLATRAVASMASRLVLGRAARRIGRGRLITISIVMASASLLAFAIPMPLPALFVVAVTLGVGLGVGQPLTMSWVTEQVPSERRATALAVRLAGNRASQLSIPAVLGVFGAGLGASAVLGVTGLVLAATLFLVRGVRLDGDAPPGPNETD